MHLGLRAVDGGIATTVVRGRVTLAEVVGLDLGGVTAEPLPINLVQVIRLEHKASDDASAGRGLNPHVHLAEEDVLCAGNSRCLALLLDREDGALVAVSQCGPFCQSEEVVFSLGEVDGRRATNGRIGFTL